MNTKCNGLIALAVVLLFGSISALPSRALEADLVQKASRAAVQLGPVVVVTSERGTKELKHFGWGSGTILAGGFILTNQHVSDVSSIVDELRGNQKFEVLEDKLIVMMMRRTDEPPVAAYIAEVVASDETLDLTVLRIAYDMNGQAVDPAELELPYLELGDSDMLELGDKISVFGYPGIGGDTITFTSGVVAQLQS